MICTEGIKAFGKTNVIYGWFPILTSQHFFFQGSHVRKESNTLYFILRTPFKFNSSSQKGYLGADNDIKMRT